MNKKLKLSLILAVVITALTAFACFASAAMLGDIDGDAKISSADARLALRMAVKLDPETPETKAAADVNFDGFVKSDDARLILRAAVGLEKLVCTHAYSEWVVTTAATCAQPGVRTRTCSMCGDKQTEAIAATGKHSHVRDAAQCIAPTCTNMGLEVSVCSVCGDVKKSRTDFIAHTFSTLTADKPASCTEAGYREFTCDVCGNFIHDDIPAKGHTPGAAATCTTAQTCTVCGVTLANALGHNPGAAATCTTVQTCKRCGEVITPALGHNGGAAATCTTNQVCLRCNQIIDYAHHTDADNNYICDICGKTMEIERFNDMVNPLKANAVRDKVTYFMQTDTSSETTNFDFGLSTPVIQGLFKDAFNSDEVSYTDLYKHRTISATNFPAFDENYISRLNDKDALIKTETGKTVDFVSELKDTYNRSASSSFSIKYLKDQNSFTNVKKVTVTVNNEKYTDVKNINGMTSLMKVYSSDIRELMNSYPVKNSETIEGLGTMNMQISCSQITSGAVITFYFDGATDQPIAAKYDVTISCDQKISMSGISMATGSIDLKTTNRMQIFYFFEDFYTAS